MVWETKNSAGFAAEKVFVNDASYWLAERGKTADQGFTIKVDSCARWIYGCKLKNLDSGHTWQTKGFRVLGSLNENGPFDTLVEDELKDTQHGTWPAVEFSFENPVQLQFIKFELISYWRGGGALYYFAAVPGRGKNYHSFSQRGEELNLTLSILLSQLLGVKFPIHLLPHIVIVHSAIYTSWPSRLPSGNLSGLGVQISSGGVFSNSSRLEAVH